MRAFILDIYREFEFRARIGRRRGERAAGVNLTTVRTGVCGCVFFENTVKNEKITRAPALA